MERFSIYWATVKFEDTEEIKMRPILILDDNTSYVLSMPMTSQSPRADEYTIKHWAEAGLKKPTTIRTGKRLTVSTKDIREQIGILHEDDILLLRFRYSL